MSNKLPTAEEFIDNRYAKNGNVLSVSDTKKLMIEFAKLHVEVALERAYNNRGWSWTNSDDENVKKDLFKRNSYPLTNIK